MHVEWYGHSSFALRDGDTTVFIDPFGDMSAAAAHGLQFDYPPISGVTADVLLVTHEHRDHNAVEVIDGSPAVLRSTAGRLESPIGEILAVASEHDTAAGTERGPNTIFAFDFGGLRVCHFGDFGQSELRPEQAAALGSVDLLMIPVGGGLTIGAAAAADIARRLNARWVVPMHYRTPRISFLETADAFLEQMPSMMRLDTPSFDTASLNGAGAGADSGAGTLARSPSYLPRRDASVAAGHRLRRSERRRVRSPRRSGQNPNDEATAGGLGLCPDPIGIRCQFTCGPR